MMLKNASFAASLALITALGLGTMGLACGGKKPPKPMEPAMTDTKADAGSDAEVDAGPPAPKSLFDRLGGKEGIEKVVDSFLSNATKDAEIKKVFAKTTGARLDAFKKNLVDQICEASGGPCKYAGKDMKTAHKGMAINEKQWNAFVTDLTAALDENKVAENDKNELFGLLAPMHDDIVEKKK